MQHSPLKSIGLVHDIVIDIIQVAQVFLNLSRNFFYAIWRLIPTGYRLFIRKLGAIECVFSLIVTISFDSNFSYVLINMYLKV